MVVQYEKKYIVVRWFDRVLKILKPEEEQCSTAPFVFGARVNNLKRKTLSK
jgi:hypothetical protein